MLCFYGLFSLVACVSDLIEKVVGLLFCFLAVPKTNFVRPLYVCLSVCSHFIISPTHFCWTTVLILIQIDSTSTHMGWFKSFPNS